MNRKQIMKKIEDVNQKLDEINEKIYKNFKHLKKDPTKRLGRLGDPLSSREIKLFEEMYCCSLPLDYKLFLQYIGNGGQSYYDTLLLKLKDTVRNPLYDRFIPKENLSKDFIFNNEVNSYSDYPVDKLPYKDKTNIREFCLKNKGHFIQGMIYIDWTTSPELGILVITGPETGNMWGTNMIEFYPLTSKTGAPRITFLDWMYEGMVEYDATLRKKKEFKKDMEK